jgi:hypothetical protein
MHRDRQLLSGDSFDENRCANLMEAPSERERHAMRDDGVWREDDLGPRISPSKRVIFRHLNKP